MGQKLGAFLRVLGAGLSPQAFAAQTNEFSANQAADRAKDLQIETVGLKQGMATASILGKAYDNETDETKKREIVQEMKSLSDRVSGGDQRTAGAFKSAWLQGRMDVGKEKPQDIITLQSPDGTKSLSRRKNDQGVDKLLEKGWIVKERQGRSGFSTAKDIVMKDPDGKERTYTVPFNNRTGKFDFGGRQLSVKSPEQQGLVTAAKKSSGITAEERTTAAIDLPKVKSNARQLKTVVDKVLSHPGFSSVVGAPSIGKIGQFVPGTDAAGFKALFDQLGGKQFSQAYETLKGGGQITEIEGEKATNALSTMRTSVSEVEFKKAAEIFKTEIDRLTGIAEQRATGGLSKKQKSRLKFLREKAKR